MQYENKILQRKDIKVYTPCNFETNIKGYWLANNEKLHIDDIFIQSVNTYQFQRLKHSLYKRGEKAIFYVQNGQAHIEDKEGLTLLKRKRIFPHNNLNDELIKDYCKTFGGCTVFKIENSFIVEVWTK